jgi:hypothetical protein
MPLYQRVAIQRNNPPMNKEDAWIIGLEAPDGRRIGIDKDGVAAYGHLRKGLCAIIHGRVGGTSVDDLELVAMHVPGMAAGIEVIDNYFNALSLG